MSKLGTLITSSTRAVTLVVLFSIIALASAVSHAAVNTSTEPLSAADLEIVVVEAKGCIYCHLFRRDVLPTFEASQRAKSVPMRFMDLKDVDPASLGLSGPIESLPTVLVLKRNKEIGRIPGYVGPQTFFLSINRLLSDGE